MPGMYSVLLWLLSWVMLTVAGNTHGKQDQESKTRLMHHLDTPGGAIKGSSAVCLLLYKFCLARVLVSSADWEKADSLCG